MTENVIILEMAIMPPKKWTLKPKMLKNCKINSRTCN